MKTSLCLLLGASLCAPALAEAPRIGRYMPLYPGQYLDLDYSMDKGDRSFDASGQEQPTATPALGLNSALPRDTLSASVHWQFPFFESYALPFVSDRIWLGHLRLEHVSTQTRGELATQIQGSDGALRNNGSGIGDMHFEFGTFLFGAPSSQWREGNSSRIALQLRLGLRANFGEYDRDAPTSAGENTPGWHAALGLHARPWSGGFIDAGLRWSAYAKNQDPAFGALTPTQRGDSLDADLSLGQRLLPGLYLSLFATEYAGERNRYDNVRFTPNPPPDPGPGSDQYPSPGSLYDRGSSLRTVGAGISWFLSQRIHIGLHYTRPIEGQSGELDVPYTERSPAGCTVGSLGCTTRGGDTVRTDAYGPARISAADRVSVSLSYHFLERDTFDCRGCSE